MDFKNKVEFRNAECEKWTPNPNPWTAKSNPKPPNPNPRTPNPNPKRRKSNPKPQVVQICTSVNSKACFCPQFASHSNLPPKVQKCTTAKKVQFLCDFNFTWESKGFVGSCTFHHSQMWWERMSLFQGCNQMNAGAWVRVHYKNMRVIISLIIAPFHILILWPS